MDVHCPDLGTSTGSSPDGPPLPTTNKEPPIVDDTATPAVGMSSSRGHRDLNCDIATDYTFPGTGVLAAAVVDGSDNSMDVADIACTEHCPSRT